MKNIKHLLCILFTALLFVSCGDSTNDEPENPNGLYDWEITKSIYNTEFNQSELISRENEYLHDKTEAYVKAEKQAYEAKSTKWTKYKYAYRKMN